VDHTAQPRSGLFLTINRWRAVAAAAASVLLLATPALAHTGSSAGGFVGGFAHPLFGPESGRNGIKGRKIAVCPVRGSAVAQRIAAFLRRALGLKVFVTSPEEHDWEAAVVQGVTHLIAKVLVQMEPLPTLLTTASFDHLMQATEMVRYDAPSVYMAIERDNPFASAVRERFLALAVEARADLEEHE